MMLAPEPRILAYVPMCGDDAKALAMTCSSPLELCWTAAGSDGDTASSTGVEHRLFR